MTKYYETLAGAIAAVEENVATTIVMVGNTEESVTVLNGKTITLDLNDCTVTNKTDDAKALTIASGATVTITDDGTDDSKAGTINGGVSTAGTTTITGGTINGGVTVTAGETNITGGTVNGEDAVLIHGGTVKISGNTTKIVGTSHGVFMNRADGSDGDTYDGKLEITSGTITGGNNGGISVNTSKAEATISGGTITALGDGVFSAGKVTISGGTIESTGAEALEVSGSAIVTGGTFTGKDVSVLAHNTVEITGGKFKGKLVENNRDKPSIKLPTGEGAVPPIFDGRAEDIFDFCVDCYPTANTDPLTKDTFRITVIAGEPEVYLHSIDTYMPLAQALTSAEAADQIDLVKNIKPTEKVTFPSDKNIQFNLNGFTIEGTRNGYIENQGELTIFDDSPEKKGKIVGSTYGILNTGVLTLKSGTISANSFAIYQNDASAETTIEDGNVTSTNGIGLANVLGRATVIGGTIEALTGIAGSVFGQVQISNGTVIGTSKAVSGEGISITGGWFSEKVKGDYIPTGSGILPTPEMVHAPNEKAPFTVKGPIDVKFADVDGAKAADDMTGGYGTTIIVPNVYEAIASAKIGKTFNGWGYDGAVYAYGNEFTLPADTTVTVVTLTATWVDSTYKVTFDAVGGTPVPDAQTVTHGLKATKPETDPTREGFIFGGWQLEGSAYDFKTEVTGDITLTAKWDEAVASITKDGKTTPYATLADAMNAAVAGDTVVLLKDTETASIPVEKKVTVAEDGQWGCSG